MRIMHFAQKGYAYDVLFFCTFPILRYAHNADNIKSSEAKPPSGLEKWVGKFRKEKIAWRKEPA